MKKQMIIVGCQTACAGAGLLAMFFELVARPLAGFLLILLAAVSLFVVVVLKMRED